MVHIIRSHKSYKAEYKYIRDMCQQDRPKGVTERTEKVCLSMSRKVSILYLDGHHYSQSGHLEYFLEVHRLLPTIKTFSNVGLLMEM